jgi:hypothetical protein
MQQKKKRGFNWSSLLGWLIFILIFAGAPLLRVLRQLFGGSLALPANLGNLIPLAVGALVVLSIAVSVVRALGGASRGGAAPNLPTGGPPKLPPAAPMPPFGGAGAPRMPPLTSSAPTQLGGSQQKLPTPPSFEPVVNGRVVVFGILGLALLAVLALVVLGGSLP